MVIVKGKSALIPEASGSWARRDDLLAMMEDHHDG